MMVNRVKLAGETLVNALSVILPDVTIIRTYTPAVAFAHLDANETTVLVTFEDVLTDSVNSMGTKWTDVLSFTVAVVHRLENLVDATAEADDVLELVQRIRDGFRYRSHVVDTMSLRVVTTTAEHSASRPPYVRSKLDENLFVGFLLVEVRINGIAE